MNLKFCHTREKEHLKVNFHTHFNSNKYHDKTGTKKCIKCQKTNNTEEKSHECQPENDNKVSCDDCNI